MALEPGMGTRSMVGVVGEDGWKLSGRLVGPVRGLAWHRRRGPEGGVPVVAHAVRDPLRSSELALVPVVRSRNENVRDHA